MRRAWGALECALVPLTRNISKDKPLPPLGPLLLADGVVVEEAKVGSSRSSSRRRRRR